MGQQLDLQADVRLAIRYRLTSAARYHHQVEQGSDREVVASGTFTTLP